MKWFEQTPQLMNGKWKNNSDHTIEGYNVALKVFYGKGVTFGQSVVLSDSWGNPQLMMRPISLGFTLTFVPFLGNGIFHRIAVSFCLKTLTSLNMK